MSQPHDLHFHVEDITSNRHHAVSIGETHHSQGSSSSVEMMNPIPHAAKQQQRSGHDSGDHTTTNSVHNSSSSNSLQYVHDTLKQSAHPVALIFHILFKGAALFLYIFGGLLTTTNGDGSGGAQFIGVTVALVLLLAADFWTVKNVTGRLLVGLRWWNKVDGETTTWIFESAPPGRRPVNGLDQTVFWTVLYGTPLIWAGLFVLGLIRLKFTWLMIVIMALALSGANVYGYYKCSTDQKAKFEQMTQNYAQQGAMALMKSGVMGLVGSSASHTNSSRSSSSGGGPGYMSGRIFA